MTGRTTFVRTATLKDEDLTGLEAGQRYAEALRNPKHPEHEYATALFDRQCRLDTIDAGINPDSCLGPGSEVG